MRWPALLMLWLILVQSIGVAACVDHDLHADSTTSAGAIAQADSDLPAKRLALHASNCGHCSCPHFVALPILGLPPLAELAAAGAIDGRAWRPCSLPPEPALRPPARV